MKLARVGVIAAAILAVATVAFAQTKPDFSGTWVIIPGDAPAGGGGGGRGMAGPMTVTVKGDVLTIERTMGDNKVTQTYNLTGTETVNKQMGRGGNEVEIKSTTKWDGSKLVITSTRPGQDGSTITTTQSWVLDPGGVLIVEQTGGRGGPITLKYKKG